MIKLLVMDVDGTLTDGKLYVGAGGEMMKAFNCKDGLGIKKLADHDIIPVIITGRSSKIVEIRAKELKITVVYQGIDDKLAVLNELVKRYQCSFADVAYIGDDENDLIAMQACGVKGCPADAVEVIRKQADFIATRDGGDGAVREFIEYILASR